MTTPAARAFRTFYRRLLPRQLKRWLPTSLFGRSLLIILLPVLAMQALVTWAFFEAHWQTVTAQLSEGLAGDVAAIVSQYEADPTPRTLERLTTLAARTQSLSVVLQPGRALPVGQRATLIPPLDYALKEAVDDHLEQAFWIDTTRYPAYVDIRVRVREGTLRILAPRDRAFAARGHVFFFWVLAATLTLMAVAVLFIRNQVRSIERLAAAAEAFGRGGDVAFKPHGAREVRQAGEAFLAMRARIQRHIEQRTLLLASVSHDLRTPLTRLKLEAALSPPSPRMDAIKGDLSEMEHMIDEFLDFARGARGQEGEGGEATARTRLAPMIDAVASGARQAGVAVTVEVADDLEAAIRPHGFKRALVNLVMNAADHGTCVVVEARAQPQGGVVIHVDDDGPGIAPERYDEAFLPFARLDAARNQNVKGVGLGLAIARDVVRGHGGDVTLDKSPMGGLRAIVTLPG